MKKFFLCLLLTLLLCGGNTFAKTIATFYSDGEACSLVKSTGQIINCAAPKIYGLNLGDVLLTSYPVSIELNEDGYKILEKKQAGKFSYKIGKTDEKCSFSKFFSMVGIDKYSWQSELGATRDLDDFTIKYFNPKVSIVFFDDRMEFIIPEETCTQGMHFMLFAIGERKQKPLYRKDMRSCRLSFIPSAIGLKKGGYRWEVRDYYGIKKEGIFYLVSDTGLEQFLSSIHLSLLAPIKNPKIRRALKYEKLGYLWRFKTLLLSLESSLSIEEKKIIDGELKRDFEKR